MYVEPMPWYALLSREGERSCIRIPAPHLLPVLLRQCFPERLSEDLVPFPDGSAEVSFRGVLDVALVGQLVVCLAALKGRLLSLVGGSCWVMMLDWYSIEGVRTQAGDLVYQAKYRDCTASSQHLATALMQSIQRVPVLSNVDLLLPCPSLKERSLPDRIADWIGSKRGLPSVHGAVKKTRDVSMKDLHTDAEKAAAVQGLFAVEHPARIAGRRVLVVDDTVGSSATLCEISRVLLAAGAKSVQAVACTKNWGNH